MASFVSRTCVMCKKPRSAALYIKVKSPFFEEGYSSICSLCIKNYLVKNNFDWDATEKLCQHFDIPFIPKEFERLRRANGDDVFEIYSQVFMGAEFEGLGWGDYYKEFKKLKEEGHLDNEVPLISDAKRKKLVDDWGANYDDEALQYLEGLYQGLLLTQNINGSLQSDQARKICKISYEIDCRIRAGDDFDKVLKAYDTLVKTAEFTPKNVKNANDFDSVGELVKWLERKGWHNPFYNNVTKDVVDETIKNMQSYNQRLYVNESGIGEDISKRIEALQTVDNGSSYYNLQQNYDLDEFEVAGYDDLMKEEFNPEA